MPAKKGAASKRPARRSRSRLRPGGPRKTFSLPPRLQADVIGTLMAKSDMFVVIQDLDGTYRYCSEPERFGFASADVLGKKPTDLFPKMTADSIMERVRRVAKSGAPMRFEDTISRQGAIAWYDHRVEPIRDAKGRITAVATLSHEISDWIGLEQALRESEERFRQLLENAPDAVFIISIGDGEIVAVNRAAARLLDRPKEELIGMHHANLYVERLEAYGRYQFESRVIQSLDRGHAKNYEIMVRRKDGSEVPVEIAAQLMEIQGKKFLFSMFRDVTVRHRIEQELRETERNYHALLDTVDLIAVMLNMRGEVIFCNQYLLTLTGWKIEEVLGKDWFDLFVPVAAVKNDFLHAVKQGTLPVRYENAIRTRDGQERVVRWSNTVLRDLNGAIFATASLGEDVTEQRRTEAALRVKDAALASSINAVALADLSGRVTYVNPAFAALWGHDAHEIEGRAVTEFWELPEEAGRVLDELITYGGWRGELSAKRKDGTTFPVQLTASVVRNEEGAPISILASFMDITDRRTREEERLKVQKLRSIGVLAGGIAHDFNNLLMAIMGNISLTKLQLNPQDRSFRLLAKAEAACAQARDLSYRLLTFSRGGEPVREALSLQAVVRSAAAEATAGSDIVLDLGFDEDMPQVKGDEGQLKQVFAHVVTNAREAMPKGGTIAIRGRVTSISGREGAPLGAGDYVEIWVQDSGVGIAQEDLDRIFDPYFTTKEMGSEKGRGLGLAICHSIIRKHDGLISVRSARNRGATFTVLLPALRAPRPVEPAAVPELPEELPTRILVMDDDEWVCQVTQQFLEHLGYAVRTVRHGQEAVDAYRKAREAGDPFSCVILDLSVPGGMGGVETLEELRAIDPQVSAIIASGFSEDPVIRDFRAHGFEGALTKPYTTEALEQQLSAVRAARAVRTSAEEQERGHR